MRINLKQLYLLLTLILFPINSYSNELSNNLKSKFTGFFNQSLNEMFPYAEFGLTSGTGNEVTGSIIALIHFQMKVILVIQLFFREACFYQMTVEKLLI